MKKIGLFAFPVIASMAGWQSVSLAQDVQAPELPPASPEDEIEEVVVTGRFISASQQLVNERMSDAFAVGVCMSQPWLAFVGFSVIFSALFSKTWRVNKLFHTQKHHSRVLVSRSDVLGPFAFICTCNVIVLTLWTVLDPLTYTRLVGDGTDLWNREIESYGACRSEQVIAYLIPLAIINFMVLGIACWQAFEARNIQSAFSEAKYIALSVASLFQAFLTGFPLLAIVKNEPRAFYLVLALMILVLSEGILLSCI